MSTIEKNPSNGTNGKKDGRFSGLKESSQELPLRTIAKGAGIVAAGIVGAKIVAPEAKDLLASAKDFVTARHGYLGLGLAGLGSWWYFDNKPQRRLGTHNHHYDLKGSALKWTGIGLIGVGGALLAHEGMQASMRIYDGIFNDDESSGQSGEPSSTQPENSVVVGTGPDMTVGVCEVSFPLDLDNPQVVYKYESALRDSGFDPGPVDGIFTSDEDPATPDTNSATDAFKSAVQYPLDQLLTDEICVAHFPEYMYDGYSNSPVGP